MQSGSEFTTAVLDRLLTDLHTQVADNHDAQRYPEGPAALRPQQVQRSKATFNLVVGHADRLAEVRGLFADETSRALFMDLLAYRLAGATHVKLPTNDAAHWQARRDGEACGHGISSLGLGGQFGPLQHCEVARPGRTIGLECWPSSIAWSFFIRQYFFARDDIRVAPEAGDVAIDGGACLGDTMLAFAEAVGAAGHVHAFDPGAGHLAIARHNLALNPWAQATIHPFGLADSNADAAPLPIDGASPGLNLALAAAHWPVPLRRIDTMVGDGTVGRVDFLKLDIEGCELAALRGAAETLRRFRPKLAISLYHRPEDLFEIPLWLRDLDLGYRFHLDHYTIFDEETVLYAIAG